MGRNSELAYCIVSYFTCSKSQVQFQTRKYSYTSIVSYVHGKNHYSEKSEK